MSALRQTLASLRFMAVATVVCGLAYPLLVTGVGQVLFHAQANGSRLERDGTVVGSSLIGQSFAGDPAYFQSRPSAAGNGYDPLASSASNLSPANPDLIAAVKQRREEIAAADGIAPAEVAQDAVTASGSGLDPHISPGYAGQQVARVAAARGLPAGTVERLVAEHTQGRALGFVGEPRVNVLELNLALDALG